MEPVPSRLLPKPCRDVHKLRFHFPVLRLDCWPYPFSAVFYPGGPVVSDVLKGCVFYPPLHATADAAFVQDGIAKIIPDRSVMNKAANTTGGTNFFMEHWA